MTNRSHQLPSRARLRATLTTYDGEHGNVIQVLGPYGGKENPTALRLQNMAKAAAPASPDAMDNAPPGAAEYDKPLLSAQTSYTHKKEPQKPKPNQNDTSTVKKKSRAHVKRNRPTRQQKPSNGHAPHDLPSQSYKMLQEPLQFRKQSQAPTAASFLALAS